jgi:hypothetical protein
VISSRNSGRCSVSSTSIHRHRRVVVFGPPQRFVRESTLAASDTMYEINAGSSRIVFVAVA